MHRFIGPVALAVLFGLATTTLAEELVFQPEPSVLSTPLTISEHAEYESLASLPLRAFEQPSLSKLLELRTRKRGYIFGTGAQIASDTGEFAFKSIKQTYKRPAKLEDLQNSDCMTLTTKAIALASAYDSESFSLLLRRLSYRDGKPDYLERNFLPLPDWVENNAWLLQDITASLGVQPGSFELGVRRQDFFRKIRYGNPSIPWPHDFGAIQLASREDELSAIAVAGALRKKGLDVFCERVESTDGARWLVMAKFSDYHAAIDALPAVRKIQPGAMIPLGLKSKAIQAKIAAVPEKELVVQTYVRREDVPSVLARLESGDVALVIHERSEEGKKPWLFCDHMGVLVRDQSGQVSLVHSTPPEVRKDELRRFIQAFPWIAGVKFLRVRADGGDQVKNELARLRVINSGAVSSSE